MTGTLYYVFIFFAAHYLYRLSHILGLAFALLYVYCAALPLYYLSQSISDADSMTDGTKTFVAWYLKVMAPIPPALLNRDPDMQHWRKVLALAPTAALFSSAWAAMAYGIALFVPHAYAHPEQTTDWLMSKHYLWQLVDIVPGLDAWKAIHIEDPLKEGRLWPGILVVLFRFIVLAVIVRTAAKLWKLAMHRETPAAAPKALGTDDPGLK